MSGRRGAGRHEPADASGLDGTVEIITIEPELYEEDEGEIQHPGSGGPAPFRLEDEEEEDEEEGEDGAY